MENTHLSPWVRSAYRHNCESLFVEVQAGPLDEVQWYLPYNMLLYWSVPNQLQVILCLHEAHRC